MSHFELPCIRKVLLTLTCHIRNVCHNILTPSLRHLNSLFCPTLRQYKLFFSAIEDKEKYEVFTFCIFRSSVNTTINDDSISRLAGNRTEPLVLCFSYDEVKMSAVKKVFNCL